MTQAACATVNSVALHGPNEQLDATELRQRACTELLRQAAIDAGLLAPDDPPPVEGIGSQAASDAIETLLDRALQLPEPAEDDCRRHHAANTERYAIGERVRLRHVLFAVTPGVDVTQLRQRAEACLLDLRCASDASHFASVAAQLSNCPSGAQGGELGWLTAQDCAPEFAREIFGRPAIGVLPQLVHSRFGLHVVEALERQPGTIPAFETVRSAVMQTLRQQNFATALRQYVQLLAGHAHIEGVDLDSAPTPLVQ